MSNLLLYIETLVNGQVVTEVKKGDAVELRVVYQADTGQLEILIQRRNGVEYPQVSSGKFSVSAGTYYTTWRWTETEEPAQYYIKTALFFNGVQVDWKEFPYKVAGVTTTTPPPGTQPPPSTEPTKSITVYFWNDEPFFEPPARAPANLLFKNLVSAKLHTEVILGRSGTVDNVKFNGSNVKTGGDTDVTNMIRSGENIVEINYSLLLGWLPTIGIPSGRAIVYITMAMNLTDAEYTALLEQNRTANPDKDVGKGGFDLNKLILYGGIAAVAVGGIILVTSLRKSPMEKAVEQMMQIEMLKQMKS